MLTFCLHSDEEICEPFQRIPRKNIFPDYHEVIANPIAFSTVRVSYPSNVIFTGVG